MIDMKPTKKQLRICRRMLEAYRVKYNIETQQDDLQLCRVLSSTEELSNCDYMGVKTIWKYLLQ